jgi:ribosomal protein S18 acetylase RimI-like enzyme
VPAGPSSQEQLSAVQDFLRQTNALLPVEVHEIPEGWVVRSRAWPGVWMLNHVRVTSEVTYEQATELCRRYLSDSNYDHLYVEHQGSGQALVQRFRQEGWKVDVEVNSILSGEPDRPVDTGAVIEPDEDEALALMKRWLAEDETLQLTPEDLDHLLEANRLTWRVRGARRLGIRGSDGRLAGITMLFSDGRIGQVEDVYVIPEARGRSYGRMLVTRAIDLAREGGHELAFIVADDNDWPKQLYRKLGFQPIGRSWLFHREDRSG